MEDVEGARRVFARLAEAGISMDDVTQTVLDSGVKLFADSFRQLLQSIEPRRRGVPETRPAKTAG